MSSADSICKQFGTQSGPTKRRAWSGFKMFDTLMGVYKSLFWKKISKDDNKYV